MEERIPLQQMINQHNKALSAKLTDFKGLSEMLGISKTKAQELMRRADAPVIQIGRSKYVVISKVDAWIDEMIENNKLY